MNIMMHRLTGWTSRLILPLLLTGAMGCMSIVYVPAPPPSPKVENPWPCKRGTVWVPGAWTWENGNYAWVPGYCKKKPRSGAVWSPGKWEKVEKGWYWAPGSWRG